MSIPGLSAGAEQLMIVVGLLVVAVLFVFAVRELAAGAYQRRVIASRSALAELERKSATPLARFDKALRRTEVGKRLERRITRSGMDIRVGTFVLVSAGITVATVVVVWRVLAPVLGVMAIAGAIALVAAYLRHQEDRRREEFVGQLPELARVLSNATSAGLALPTAIDMASEELEDPAATELRQMAGSMKLGMSFEQALEEMRERMPSREIGVLASTLFVASRAGGSLVTALRNISETLENRKETRREVRTILGETTVTSWALLVLFLVVLFGINLAGPGTLAVMTTEMPGQLILAVSFTLATIGIVLVRRVTRINF